MTAPSTWRRVIVRRLYDECTRAYVARHTAAGLSRIERGTTPDPDLQTRIHAWLTEQNPAKFAASKPEEHQ